MYVPQIQNLVENALTPAARHALRLDFLRAAAGLAIPIGTKPTTALTALCRWPRIGGADLVVAPDMTVETDEYQRRWQASDLMLWIYALGCPGLQDLGRALGLPAFKLGTTEAGIQHRLVELGRDGYGNSFRTVEGRVLSDPGFGRGQWVAEQLPVTLDLSPLSPVHPSVRGIGVRLPVGMPAAIFERLFSAQIASASLARVIASPAGRKLCAGRGVDPARCRRITQYRFGADVRPSAEEEFTIFRPRAESNRLAAIAERIVVEHVMGGSR